MARIPKATAKRSTIEGREDNPDLMLPEEIANVAVFLASERSSAITGTAIDAFGGNNPLFS